MPAPAPLTLQSRVGGILYDYLTQAQLVEMFGFSHVEVEDNVLVITTPD